MGRKRKKERDQMDEVGIAAFWPPPWFTTYSDFSTLVMTFFIILSCMLVLKIDVSVLSGQKKLGDQTVLQDSSQVKITVEMKKMIDAYRLLEEQQLREMATITKMEEAGKNIQQYIQEVDLEAFVKVEASKWKVKVVPLMPFLFAPGRAALRPEAKDFLDRLAKVFAANPGQIRIAGHTDSLPIYSAEYRSNWELSADRAAAIMRYLVEVHGLDPQRFVAVGCGPYHPIADNATPEGRRENRRVEIEITQEPNPAGAAEAGAGEAGGAAAGAPAAGDAALSSAN